MPFYNRTAEIRRIEAARARARPQCIVVYGRRRCGKSTLLQQTMQEGDVYFMATQSDAAVQRQQLARALDAQLPGFSRGTYGDWSTLFAAMTDRPRSRFALILDEFPYLVKADTSVPSVLQRLLENREALKMDVILCGSSQQMMQDYILHAAAPLYGRADEIIKVVPLRAGWLGEHLIEQSSQAIIEEYATWGGVPRYWELRSNYGTYTEAVRQLVLDPIGILHEEPTRLLLDDMRDPGLSSALLSVVANGAHKLTEIGGRLHKPTTDLNRPLNRLISLGYLKREKPYGASVRDKKRNLYKVHDPFMRFYYRYVFPALSELELGLTDRMLVQLQTTLPGFVSYEWEELCRTAVSLNTLPGGPYRPARRWWGNDRDGKAMELDIVTESVDGSVLLVGECKWSDLDNAEVLTEELRQKAERLPLYRKQEIRTVIAARSFAQPPRGQSLNPEIVLAALR